MAEEIIIDGVDVSECEKLGETIDGITCGLGKRIRFANEIITKHNLCKNNPNCYYKQLKRKEQECEELKKERDTLNTTRNKLLDDLWVVEENLKDYMEHFNKASDELDQLKQTLTEIKDMCSEMNCESLMQNSWCGNTDFKMGCCEKLFKKQILQVISEVSNDR